MSAVDVGDVHPVEAWLGNYGMKRLHDYHLPLYGMEGSGFWGN